MRKYISICFLALLFVSCSTPKKSATEIRVSPPPDLSKVVYEGGDGLSMDSAIIIKGAGNERNGVAAEYAWVEKKYGRRSIGWQMIKQTLAFDNGKKYDILYIMILQNNDKVSLYFDITDFFGKY